MIENIMPREIDNYINNNRSIIIDVRGEREYAISHIINSINIPYDDIKSNLKRIPYGKTVVVYCDRGGKSILAAKYLDSKGYKVKNVIGGIKKYSGSSLTLNSTRFNI